MSDRAQTRAATKRKQTEDKDARPKLEEGKCKKTKQDSDSEHDTVTNAQPQIGKYIKMWENSVKSCSRCTIWDDKEPGWWVRSGKIHSESVQPLYKINLDGEITSILTEGLPCCAGDICLDPEGNLLVADLDNGGVLTFSRNGELIREMKKINGNRGRLGIIYC